MSRRRTSWRGSTGRAMRFRATSPTAATASRPRDEFQPRLGFSYDLTGDEQVDRLRRRRHATTTASSSTPRSTSAIACSIPVYRIRVLARRRAARRRADHHVEPMYLTRRGLDRADRPGRHDRPRDLPPQQQHQAPVLDQCNLGVPAGIRQWLGSLSYNDVRGYRGIHWRVRDRTASAAPRWSPGFGNVIISDPDGRSSWYDRRLRSPSTSRSPARWGAHVAYTHAKAQQTGNDLFSLDYPSAAAYGRHDVPGSEHDHIIANGIFGLPWNALQAPRSSLGSGAALQRPRLLAGLRPAEPRATRPFDARSIRRRPGASPTATSISDWQKTSRDRRHFGRRRRRGLQRLQLGRARLSQRFHRPRRQRTNFGHRAAPIQPRPHERDRSEDQLLMTIESMDDGERSFVTGRAAHTLPCRVRATFSPLSACRPPPRARRLAAPVSDAVAPRRRRAAQLPLLLGPRRSAHTA